MHNFPLILCLCMFLSVPAFASPNQGVVGSSLQKIVDTGLAAGDSVIRIPPGRYEVAPVNGSHLSLKGLRDVTIDARDVEMVCSETTLAILVENCVNLRIEGLTIDYDPLPFTQGRIVEISADRKSHIIEIMEGFPPASDDYIFKHSIYTAEGELRFGNYYQYQLEVLSDGRLKVFGLSNRVDGGEEVGDIVVVSNRHLSGRYIPHAIMVNDSLGTVFDGVTIYSSPCFGFFEQDSSGSIYRNCVVDRRAGRVHSLNADAFHSKHAEVGPQIIGCKAMWQGDDSINICGDYYLIADSQEDWLRILSTNRVRIQKGDLLQLVTAEGERLDDAIAVEIQRVGSLSEADTEIVSKTRIHRNKSNGMRHAYKLRLDRKVDLQPGSIVASENRMGNGFSVIDNEFGNNRSRGILIKASHGEISGNKLINTHMQSILIAPEYHWLESGFSSNLKVVNNQIIHPRREAIYIKGIGPFPGHQHLRVEDNFIRTDVRPALRIESVRNGQVSGNQIVNTDGLPLKNAIRVEFSEGLELN